MMAMVHWIPYPQLPQLLSLLCCKMRHSNIRTFNLIRMNSSLKDHHLLVQAHYSEWFDRRYHVTSYAMKRNYKL
jgi:hypothetical protein